ncbi:amino acid adenylation domain-containing protein [Kitasatospora sp. MAA19]|uniref:non-ribosomal peptide synthetase n=1 Tax=unclassified Kitasatospora TaxID=2633591 RepID=UPI002473FBF8|nr:amino acid adenylation domain-containing protein [Kitasatospora sp. MAA19]MDH6711398.1 amino acid adenylation domain-containing protein [Kitasatospora sp. MAA19]
MESERSLSRLDIASARHPQNAEYWNRLLAGSEKTGFPADHPVASGEPTWEHREVVLSTDLNRRVDTLSKGSPRSLHVVLTTAVIALLRAYTGTDDLVVGQPVPVENLSADPERAGTGIIILRCAATAEDTFATLLNTVRSAVLDGLTHRNFPVALLAEERGPAAPGHNRLCDVAVAFDGLHDPTFADSTQVPLLFTFAQGANGAVVRVRHDSRRHTPASVERLCRHLLVLLDQATADPRGPLRDITLTCAQDLALLAGFNATARPYDLAATVHYLCAARAAAQPDAIAAVGYQGTMTYGELDRRANSLAWTLQARGVETGDRVAVLMDRSELMLIAVLAVMKAGAAYVPVDPGYPADRVAFVLRDCAAKLVLISGAVPAEAAPGDTVDLRDPSAYSPVTTAPTVTSGPADPAYVIYTSGSTGTPKGVVVEHRSVVNRLTWMQEAYPLRTGDVVLQKTSISFDVSVWELFWWMIEGATVCLPAPGAERDPEAIIEAVEQHRVSVLHFVPTMLAAFLEYAAESGAVARLAPLRTVFASGEALSPAHVAAFHRLLRPGATGPDLVNLYGPTEATVDVSHFPCTEPGATVPIGRPIANTRLYVLDESHRIQPVGVPGELCIGGVGLARGYLGRPELTAERFIEAPFPGEPRIYRTGDVARWLPDGVVEYLGRTDHQVKIRGFRVELGEIEHRLRWLPEVADVAVLALGSPAALHAFIASQTSPANSDLRNRLAAVLPAFMVPKHFTVLEALPVSPNGKVDRTRLAAIAAELVAAARAGR